MSPAPPTMRRIAVLLFALLPIQPAGAAPMLQIVPNGSTDFGLGETSAQVTFEIRITGLTAGNNVVSAYDFGIIYDPDIMTLAAFNGFTDLLGNPAVQDSGIPTDVYNQNHLDATNDPGAPDPVTAADCGGSGYFYTCNSLWDYRAPDPTMGDYNGPQLGIPDITGAGAINEGSLRFSQVSFLLEDDLLLIQNPSSNDTLTLFSLTFDVDTSARGSTQIVFVDDRFYAEYLKGPSLLDVKLNDLTPQYLALQGSRVTVPVPGTWTLLAVGLAAGAAARYRRSPRDRATA